MFLGLEVQTEHKSRIFRAKDAEALPNLRIWAVGAWRSLRLGFYGFKLCLSLGLGLGFRGVCVPLAFVASLSPPCAFNADLWRCLLRW